MEDLMPDTCKHFFLDSLLPPSVAENPEDAAYELVRAVLIRSTYIPGVRHRLGWCGIHEAVAPENRPGSLTARVNDWPGVFALHPEAPGPGQVSRFGLSYFPAPDEDLVERFSIEAGIRALAPDFMEQVRGFSRHPELTTLFHIGIVDCLKADHGIFISFQARERLGWTARDGIEVETPEGRVQAVSPGGTDQDLPALDIGLAFFRPLAAAFTYTLKTGPDIFYTQKRNAPKSESFLLETREQRWTLGYFNTGTRAGIADFDDADAEEVWTSEMPVPKFCKEEPWWDPDLAGAGHSVDKKAMGISDKPRFILLTGFLGSGKTSFLDRFIQAQTASNHFVAVVQNEVGEKGLDAALLDETYAVTQMDEGCVCCSLAGNLRAALSDILDRFQPDFIVLETTGLANPANILREVDDLDDLFELASITSIVDCLEGSRTLDRFEVARDQVRLADVVLLNKCDLCGSGQDALEEKIRRLNPGAAVHPTCHGDIHPGLLYGVNFRNSVQRPLFSAMGAHATHADDRIETRLLDLSGPINEANLKEAIRAGGEHILRVKGIAEFTDRSGPMVFQYAPGTFRISAFSGDNRDRFLVVIGQDLDTYFDGRSVL